MPRSCKCHATGEYGNVELFYRPKGQKYYFKDKETYENWKIEEDLRKLKVQKRKKINERIAELIDYKKGQTFPTIIAKEIKDLDEVTINQKIEAHKKEIDKLKIKSDKISFFVKFILFLS